MERFDAATALKMIARHRVDWMYSVPTMLGRIADLPSEVRDAVDISSLRTIITMAAHCPERVRHFCLNYFGPSVMLELYAATEAHAIVMTDGHGWQQRPGSVGRIVLGELVVRRPDGTPACPGEVGDLWMRRSADQPGPYRYVGAKAHTSEDGWESVGDMGYLDADGYLYLADRRSDMIVVGGVNVYPAEVEAALEENPAVDAACVVGVPDPDYGQVLHAVVNAGRPVSSEDLDTFLRERLAPYKIPRAIHHWERPLRDEAGKTRRPAVREEVMAGVTAKPRR